MNDTLPNRVPNDIRAVPALFGLCAISLGVAGAVILVRPGAISMSVVAPLLFGLEQAGPYMFLLAAVAGAAVAWGLIELNNIVRHAAMLIAITGIVMLVPAPPSATVMAQPKALAFGGLGKIGRASCRERV